MARKQDGLIPIAEVFSDVDGPVKALHPAPQALHHFTCFDQVNQLVGASEPQPAFGQGARRWCMNRNWPAATNPTHRSIIYQERTTMAYRARPSG